MLLFHFQFISFFLKKRSFPHDHKLNIEMSTTSNKWNKEQDRKLLKLFNLPESRGGISTLDLSAAKIKEVINRHFPERQYSSFAPIYRRKARAFNISKSLDGARKKSVSENTSPGNFVSNSLFLFLLSLMTKYNTFVIVFISCINRS